MIEVDSEDIKELRSKYPCSLFEAKRILIRKNLEERISKAESVGELKNILLDILDNINLR